MVHRALAVLSSGLAVTLFGCAGTDPMTGSMPGETTEYSSNVVMSVQYGTVENVQQVAQAPDNGAGALVGGALGLLATVTHSGASQVAGAVAGAGLGALVAKETVGTAEKYTVRLVSNSTIDIVTEDQNIQLGDCVAVEQGRHANIRRVSSVMCTTKHTDPAFEPINAAAVKASSDCQQAKQDLLKASTMEQTDIGYKKMRAFCES